MSYKTEGALVGVLPIAFKINPPKVLPGSLSLGANFKYMYKIKSFADKDI
ncbi:MAG: hypothetical protein LBN19_00195 [Endomicrobium sp.]|nr:hypothetical protein [Endomicrobium sp.]